jgi:hypothetical protein
VVRSPFFALLGIFFFFGLLIVAATALFVALADDDVEASDGCTDPETGEQRDVNNTELLANSFGNSLEEAQDAVDSGQGSATATFSESEVTSRASEFFEARDAPLSDIVICFHDGYSIARTTFEVPALHDIPAIGDDIFVVTATAEGSISFEGERPSIDITDVEAGNLPGFATDEIADQIENEVNDRIDDLQLDYTYEVTFTEGEATLTVRPR